MNLISHFDFNLRVDKASCMLCGAFISCPANCTSGLRYHIEKTHKIPFKTDDEEPKAKKSKFGEITNFLEKPCAEDLIAREAALGASFNYLAKSHLIRQGMKKEGFNVPLAPKKIKEYVHTEELIKKLKKSVQDGQRFSIITDDWTCTNKKRKYVNVNLRGNGQDINLGLQPVEGSLTAMVLKDLLVVKIESYGLKFDNHIIYCGLDGCSVNTKMGKT